MIADRIISNGGRASADVEALSARIAGLLQAEAGERLVRRLFLDVLGFERVEEPIPAAVLGPQHRDHVTDAAILGRLDTFYVCRVRVAASELSARLEDAVCRQLAKQWPGCLVAFSSFGDAEWDLCHAAASGGAVARLPLDQNLYAADELARLLLSLRAFDFAGEAELPQLEVEAAAERMFRRLPKRVRRRAGKVLLESPLFREVGRWDLLTAAEERALATRIRRPGGDPDALRRMVGANLRLALKLAKRYFAAAGGRMDLEDLWQEACIGLITAARRFEPERGTRFSTYATWWVMQTASRARQTQSHLVGIPCHLHGRLGRWRNAWRHWLVTRGYRPNVGELAGAVGEDPADAPPLLAAWRAFNRPVRLGCRLDVRDLRRDGRDGTPGRLELAEVLARAMAVLNDRQRDVLTRRFGLDGRHDMTLEEVGAVHRVTRERIRQIEHKALGKLRAYFDTTEGKEQPCLRMT